jgi:diguanylate cyclase (GGDEF)-like protein
MMRLFGYQKEEVVGRSPLEFVAEESKELLLKKLQEESVEPYEIDSFNSRGERINLLVRGENVMFEDEQVRISAIVDISKQKAQQRSLELINDQLQQMATHDQLTGLGNRHMLEEVATKEIERHRRHTGPLSMLMIDIDFFKQVNDIHGHLTGDYILKEVARIIEKESRSEDVIGRWGGEEFLILLPETDIEKAYEFGERLRQKVENHTFKSIGRLTISGGVSEFDDTKGQHEWFTEADDCLYFAKEHGRNRIVRPDPSDIGS